MPDDKPTEKENPPDSKTGDNVRKNTLTERSQNDQFEKARRLGQDFTSMTELKVPSTADFQRANAPSTFGILDENGSIMASSNTISQLPESIRNERQIFKIGGESSVETCANPSPKVDATKVVETGKKLLESPHRWKGAMCNVFVDEVLRKSGVPLPWKVTENHSCTEMVKKLSHDRNFDLVWSRDQNDWDGAAETWKYFQVHDGDIAIWANKHLVHTGLLESAQNNESNILYAGASSATGANYKNTNYFVDSPTKGYGPPDYIFRYRGFQNQ